MLHAKPFVLHAVAVCCENSFEKKKPFRLLVYKTTLTGKYKLVLAIEPEVQRVELELIQLLL